MCTYPLAVLHPQDQSNPHDISKPECLTTDLQPDLSSRTQGIHVKGHHPCHQISNAPVTSHHGFHNIRSQSGRMGTKLDKSGTFEDNFQFILPKCVRWTPDLTNLGLLKIILQYILARRAKMYWKIIFKSPRFVKFYVHLTHYMDKSASPERLDLGQRCGRTWWMEAVSLSSYASPHCTAKRGQFLSNLSKIRQMWQFFGGRSACLVESSSIFANTGRVFVPDRVDQYREP